MPREPKDVRAARAQRVIARLDAAMPEARIELDWKTPLELLMAVLLSAQTTDRRVNMVSPALFAAYPTARALADATPAQLEPFIKTVGLFRNKAKHLVKLGQALVAEHGGEVPRTRAALSKLPGVGNKTAGVVSMHLGGDVAFPVDTHVGRLARRLGFTTHAEPDDVEADLQALLPQAAWFQGHQLLVWHGRRVCHALGPECHRCVVAEDCPKRGVKAKRPAGKARD